MKLYALNGVFDYDGDTLLGVYSSPERADEAMKHFIGEEKFKIFDDYFVQEFELDSAPKFHWYFLRSMTYRVEVGEGGYKFSVYYDDYGNAAECALAYREQGFEAIITEEI